MKLIDNPYPGGGCFFCGPANPIGLKLSFYETEDEPKELVCRWQPGKHYRGLGSVLHGGIQCGLFDEIMGWTAHHLTGQSAVTGQLHAKFLKPVRLGQEIEVRCRIDEIKGREVWLEAEIKDSSGHMCTKARGSYIQIPQEQFGALMGDAD